MSTARDIEALERGAERLRQDIHYLESAYEYLPDSTRTLIAQHRRDIQGLYHAAEVLREHERLARPVQAAE